MNGPCLVMVAQERGLPQRKLGDKQNGSISFSFSCFPFGEIENPNKLKGLGFFAGFILVLSWSGQQKCKSAQRDKHLCSGGYCKRSLGR